VIVDPAKEARQLVGSRVRFVVLVSMHIVAAVAFAVTAFTGTNLGAVGVFFALYPLSYLLLLRRLVVPRRRQGT